MHTVIAFDHFPEDRFGRRTENRTADEFPPLGSIIDIDPFAPEVFDKFRIVFRIIFHCIKSKGKTVGAIGVIGPLRMDYARVLATLDSLGGNISQLLSEPKLIEKGDSHDG